MVNLWQADPFKHPDPYQELTPEFTLKDVKAELAVEEGLQISSGELDPSLPMSESQFLAQGLEIEGAQ